ISLLEGNKGLYDGLDLDGSNSNAALAKLLGAPVVLVIDARGMTRGVAPLILGYQAFDPDIRIAGVILNNLGGSRHESTLRAVIEHYTEVEVIGAVQHDASLQIAERHLGLVPANEQDAARAQIAHVGERVAAQVDLARLLAIADSAPAMPVSPPAEAAASAAPVRIGIAHDPAFGFYYSEDLDSLRAANVELVDIDTLHAQALPDVDGLIIGGGFPEMFMAELEANAALRKALRKAIEGGLPTYAECGGLMYLARSLAWHGETRHMAGVLSADVVMHEKPVGRGYVRLQPTAAHPWVPQNSHPEEIPAHEFHYSSLENLDPATVFAYEVKRGHGIDGRHDGIVYKNLLASYTHLRSAGNCNWAARFVGFARQCLMEKAA
ncbi:MAG: cobyrinate a,c-diamide synthase, partial [Polycyclovorans sp.]|nr:cobyrinate a,c-diamide synthase [Polycyclovorans sp.]